MVADRRFILRHGLHGLAGTACVAVGALGVGWLPLETELLDFPLVAVLRSGLTASLASRALIFLGLALLLQSWLVLGSELDGRVRRGRDLAWVLTLWASPLILVPPLFSRDAYSYYVQGRLMVNGLDPTTQGVSAIPGWFQDGADPMWAESPTPYGPLFLMIERTIAGFAHPNAYLAGLLFRLVGLVGVALLVVMVPRLAEVNGVEPDRALWLAVLNPLILMHFVLGAHNDALMVGLVVTGLWLAATCRCTWGAVAIGLAVVIKPIAILALPFVGLAWAGPGSGWLAKTKAWLLAALVAGVTAVCAFLVAGAGAGLVSAALGTPAGVLTWLSPTTAIGQLLGGTTTLLGWTDSASWAVTTVRSVGSVAAVGIIGWLILRPGDRSPTRGAALAFATAVVLGPVIQPWYLLWFLPLFAVTGLTRRQSQAAVLITAAFTVHGMVESSTTSDNFLDITDGITFLVAVGIVALILLASTQERALILGPRVAPEPDESRHLGS